MSAESMERGRDVAVVVVGDEVLAGDVTETNAAWLARELARAGSRVRRVVVLPDTEEVIASHLVALAAEFEAVLVTGGIGATHDDVTRQAVARAFRRPLTLNAEAERLIVERYGPDTNPWRRRLAELPEPCRLIPNPLAAAPGFIVENVYVFPGVPRMMQEMFPLVAAEFTGPRLLTREMTTHLSESSFAGPLGEIAASLPDVGIGSYPSVTGERLVRLVLKAVDPARLEEAARRVSEMLSRLGG